MAVANERNAVIHADVETAAQLVLYEKPGAELAAAIIARGGLWNSFVMVFRVARAIELITAVRPDDVRAMQRLAAAGRLHRDYNELPRWNFSADFLGHIPDHLAVIDADRTHWSDWGTREAIERTFATLNQIPPWLLSHNRAESRRVAVS